MGNRIFSTLLALSLLLPAASAAETGASYDGYLFQLREEHAMLYRVLPEGIDPVLPDTGVYRAEFLEDIRDFVPEEDLAYIEPDYLVTLFDEPNDPLYGQQWSLSLLGAEEAWSAGLDGGGVRIGIVDSGLWEEHEDLAGARIAVGHNYVNDSEDTEDEVGHGTFVTGLIAAARGNGLGIAGLAPGAEIVPLKCFSARTGRLSDIVEAIRGGVEDYHCDILNMSFGLSYSSQTLENVIACAAEQGVILMAAVGNSGGTALNYPAAYDSVIGVGMVGPDGVVAAGSQRNESVFVVAPGYQVLGLGTDTANPYKVGSGTSYACPYLSAVAALLKQADPGLSAGTLMAQLQTTAVDLGEPGYDTSYGCGLVSLTNLLMPFLLQPAWREDRLLIRGVSYSRRQSPLLLVAYRDGLGRMLACTELEVQKENAVLTIDCMREIPAGAEKFDIYALDRETLYPLQQVTRVESLSGDA